MVSPKYGVLAAAFVLGVSPLAFGQSQTYGVGKAASADELRKWDIAIGFAGKELPPGSGTAQKGEPIFAQKCAGCHGAKGEGGRAPVLIVDKSAPQGGRGGRGAGGAGAGGAGGGGGEGRERPGRDAATYMFGIPGPGLMPLNAPNATIIWDYINRAMPIGREGSLMPDEVYSLTAFLMYKADLVKQDEELNQQNLAKIKMPNVKKWEAPPPAYNNKEPRVKGYMQAPPASR